MTDSVKFEDGLVSVLRVGGVSIARPAEMTRLELGLVLHGLAGTLIAEEVEAAASVNGNGVARIAAIDTSRFAGLEVEPGVQSPQGKDRKTKSDRRCLPRRKVVRRIKKGRLEVLECGHRVAVPANWKKHASRACSQCVAVAS